MTPIDRYLNFPRGRAASWSEDGTRLVRPDGREFPILGSNGSAKDRLLADAAAGLISSDVNVIETAYHTTPGDEGGARYRRVTAAQLAAYGMSAMTLAMVAFPDASGDTWLLDEPSPHLAMVGCFGQPLGAQPLITSDYDCSDYLLSAADYGVKRWGAVVIRYGNRNYYIHRTTSLPANAGLTGPETQGNSALHPPDLEAVAGVNWMPGMVINPAVSLRVRDNFFSDFICVKRAGIVIHTDAVGALDAQGSFAGVGITKASGGSARNVKINNFVSYGFAFGLLADKMHGLRMGDIFGDCLTLVMGLDSGETMEWDFAKRKPILTVNDAIKDTSVNVLSMYDAGGKVGLVVDADVTAAGMGLTTGQRCGNQKLDGPFDNTLRTVTVVDGTHVVLEGTTWDAAYASWTPRPGSSITWNPGLSSGVASFYSAGGKIGVRTIAALPFNPGHKALLGTPEDTPRGMLNVLTRVSATDFVLDAAWDSALLSLTLTDCELAAMPSDRTHSEPVSYWGTTEGYGLAFDNCDGVRGAFANKGGSGVFVNSASVQLLGSNEGGSTGNTDRNNPRTTGIRVRQNRGVFTGAYKSTGDAMHWDMEGAAKTGFAYGLQLTDGGRSSFRLTRGRAWICGVTTKGPGRVVLDDTSEAAMSTLDVLIGDITPWQLIGTAANKSRTALRWRNTSDLRAVHQIAHTWAWWAWDASGNPVQVATMNADGLATKPKALTVASGALTLTNDHHGADIELTGTGNGIALDAATVYDGFRVVIRNHRGSDWAWPAFIGGTVQLIGVFIGTPTKLRNLGEMTLTVRDVNSTRLILLSGHLVA